jgi:thymidylate kinase
MKKVRNGYQELSCMFPERIKKINAEESPQNVTASIIATIDSLTL